MSDILRQIQRDARRLRVARKLPDEGPVSYDLVRLVQEDFETFCSATGLSLADVARRMGKGFSGPTLSAWRSFDPHGDREFKGDVDRITRGINAFMETYAQQMTAPQPEGFVETGVAKKMLAVVREAIKLRQMGLITSDSGRGKTIVMKAAQSIFPGAIYVRVLSGAKSPTGLAKMLAHELRIRSVRTTLDIQFKIIETLSGTGRVLLIDEAHQLNGKALEFVRDIADTCDIPIILGGTRKIDDQTSDQDVFFGQFASRVAVRYDVNDDIRDKGGRPVRPIHTPQDVAKLFASDQVRVTTDGIAALTRLANIEGFGGLRLCVQIYRLAATVAQAKGTDIDARLIVQVQREMHGKTIRARQIETEAAKVRVA